MRSLFWKSAFLALVLSLTGCAGSPISDSGFLSDYSKLKPNPRMPGSYIYFSEGKNLSQYSKFYIGQVVVFLNSEGMERKVDPSKLNQMSDYFRTELIEALQDKYSLVGLGRREPGTLHIKAALTDVLPPSGNEESPSGFNVGGASLEAELVDYNTGEIVGAVIVSQTESGTHDSASWDNTRRILKSWAQRFRARLDETHK